MAHRARAGQLYAVWLSRRRGTQTHAAIKIPWLLGLIATRSIDLPVLGIYDLVERARARVVSGMEAYSALQVLRAGPAESPDAAALQRFEANQADLGYALLLLRFTDDPAAATPQQIDAAAWSTVPNVPVLFWSFRIMVGLGLFFIALFATAFYLASRHRFDRHPWFLKLAFSACRCLGLPSNWVGSSPSMAVNRGRLMACCPRSSVCRAPLRAMCGSRWWDSRFSIPLWPWWMPFC